ncbi:MAG: hypothetical protein KatS3mg105_3787 [Gemmatales bacterium]|nr:MAG: hypothetical protein KatS3mg105_3787 [Gemmatales bacterium]
MNEQLTTPWDGDWQERLRSKLESLGFRGLDDFLANNPGKGYVELAKSLGDANVAASQIYGEQIRSAAARGDLRSAAKDCLVRFINEYVKRGWGVGRYFLDRSASAYAAWATTIKGNVPNDEQIERRLKTVFDRLEAASPPNGWLPKDPNDPLIERAFAEGWPMG